MNVTVTLHRNDDRSRPRLGKCFVLAFWLWLSLVEAPLVAKLSIEVAHTNGAERRENQTYVITAERHVARIRHFEADLKRIAEENRETR